MNLTFTPDGCDDYLYWETDKAVLRRLNRLIEDTLRATFERLAR